MQGNLTVLGSSSIQYVTSSQLNIGNNKIVLNTSTPAVQFGGISVVDSGSGQATGSLYWDSLSNRWISQRETGAAYNSAILIAGPKNVGNLGQELGLTTNNIPVVTDGIHLGDSQITDNGTTVSITNNLSVGTAITASIVTATSYSSSIANGVGYFGTSSFATSASFAPTILPAGIVSSSLQINTGSFTGSFTGILSGSVFGTASNAISSSFATTASAATSITFTPLTASFANTASAATSITFTPPTASFATSASYALSASYAPGGSIVVDTHTFTGDGIVSNYTLGKAYDISSVTVTVGGLTQTSTTHYTLTGTNLSFLVAPPSQSSIFVRAIVNVSTGSVGSFSGSFTGILLATNVLSSSFATTASAATSITFTPTTASFANTASAATSITFTPLTASFANTASAATSITFTPLTASFATSASFAPTILPSGIVSSSEQINTGSFTGSFAGILSGSVFGTASRAESSSYALYAGFAEQSVTTIAVTNNGASYYLLDGVVKPVVTFVPGTTYRFDTSGVVGSHPFRFSLTANGPTEYTSGVTVGTNYTEIDVTYATSSSLFYYCTFHSGMGNQANTLRSENLITASQTGSMRVLSSSYASTASNAVSASYAPTILPTVTIASSAQVQLNEWTGTTFSASNFTFPQNLTVAGTLVAQEFITEYVSSSIIYESGSTKFGDTSDDVMSVTGSIRVLGAISTSGTINSMTIGFGAGGINTNTVVGSSSLAANTTGTNNTATGQSALRSNTTGNYNTAIGYEALTNNTTADNNTATGQAALRSNTTGGSNTAIGQGALYSNTAGAQNTAIGQGTLLFNTTGDYNTATGKSALAANTTGANNTADGYQALTANTTGYQNVGLGGSALSGITTGYHNVAVGYLAGANLLGGAGSATTNTASVFLGHSSRASANGNTNEIVIGAFAEGNGSNSATYGNVSMSKHVFPTGNVGIGTTNPSASLHVVGTMMMQGVIEQVKVTASAPPSTLNFDALSGSVLYQSASTANNWTINFRGSSATSLNSMMYPGQSMTFAVLVNHATVGYTASVHQVDGTTITPRWQGGTLPSGSGTSTDIYSYTLIKTANAAFNIFAAQTKFA